MSLCNRYNKCLVLFFVFLFRGEMLHYFLLQWVECKEIFIFLPLTPWKLLFSVASLDDPLAIWSCLPSKRGRALPVLSHIILYSC